MSKAERKSTAKKNIFYFRKEKKAEVKSYANAWIVYSRIICLFGPDMLSCIQSNFVCFLCGHPHRYVKWWWWCIIHSWKLKTIDSWWFFRDKYGQMNTWFGTVGFSVRLPLPTPSFPWHRFAPERYTIYISPYGRVYEYVTLPLHSLSKTLLLIHRVRTTFR